MIDSQWRHGKGPCQLSTATELDTCFGWWYIRIYYKLSYYKELEI
jgi:hypothetical protein